MESPWPDDAISRMYRVDEDHLRGGSEFAQLHHAQRLLQDRLAGSALPPEVSSDVTSRLLAISDLLAAYQVAEHDRRDGLRPDMPGRGHALLPPYVVDGEDGSSLWGRVTFTRFYLGGNRAAHGGAQPLLFDDLLGRVVNRDQPGIARTAFLKVNYRHVTQLDVQLRFEVSLERVDGRKRWGTGRLFDAAGHLLSDAEALFVQLLPGQG